MAQNFLILSISKQLTPSWAMEAAAGSGARWSTTGNFELLRRLENMERDAIHGELSRKLGE